MNDGDLEGNLNLAKKTLIDGAWLLIINAHLCLDQLQKLMLNCTDAESDTSPIQYGRMIILMEHCEVIPESVLNRCSVFYNEPSAGKGTIVFLSFIYAKLKFVQPSSITCSETLSVFPQICNRSIRIYLLSGYCTQSFCYIQSLLSEQQWNLLGGQRSTSLL